MEQSDGDAINDLLDRLAICNINKDDSKSLEVKLEELDIPLNWNLCLATHEDDVLQSIAKFQDKKEELTEFTEFKIRSFSLDLVIVNQYMKTDINTAFERIKECEELIDELKSNNCEEQVFLSVVDALEYITMGCKAYILFKLGVISESKEIMKNLINVDEMTSKQKSGFFGIKALVYLEFDINGSLKAIEYAKCAKQFDPTIAEWYFLSGKIMGRIRRRKNLPFTNEETCFIRTAYEMCRSEPAYILYLAQVSREEAKYLHYKFPNNRRFHPDKYTKIKHLNETASELYRELLKLNTNNSHILARCAFGLVKLPHPFRSVDLALESIKNALLISPNNKMANHNAGIIYDYLENYEEAEKYYKLAGSQYVYGAAVDLMKLRYKQNKHGYDPVPDLKDALRFQEQDLLFKTLSQLSSWYLTKSNIPEAWKYMKDIITSNPDCIFVRKFIPWFKEVVGECDLCSELLERTNLAISGNLSGSEKKDTKETPEIEELKKISDELKRLCPNVTNRKSFSENFRNQRSSENFRNRRGSRGRPNFSLGYF